MTTPTPTSDGTGASLPDLASLTELANQLFREVPGGGPSASAVPGAPTRPVSFGPPPVSGVPTAGAANLVPHPTSLPYTPPFPVTQSSVAQHMAPPTLITPRLVPTMAQTPDAPAAAATATPALGRASGPAAGVPEAYAAAAPVAAPIPGLADASIPGSSDVRAPTSLAPDASPFYFLDAASGAPQARGGTQQAPGPVAPAAAHGGTGRAPSPPQAGPTALAPSAPSVAGAPIPPHAPVPSSPYYFVGESSSYPALGAGVPSADLPRSDAYGLPGAPLPRIESVTPDARGAASPRSSRPAHDLDPAARSGAGPQARETAIPAVPAGRGAFDVHAVRKDFPILRERVNGRPLIWFDNAATTQKPQSVIDRLAHFYAHENSNIHRAAHELAARATDAYESARNKVAKFLGAGSSEEIIFVRGATEGVNLVAFSWGKQNIHEGDEIVVSHLEHHANIVPWQMLAAEKGAKLRVIPVDDTGQVRLDEYQKLLNDRTKLVAVTQVSNALGTVVPVDRIVELGHRAGAKVLIDGAQAVSHLRVNVKALGADFYVFSGHKIFGPTGIGAVYGTREVLEDMPPYQGGGNMIEDVTFEQTRYHGPPMRFEAGTGNIADAAGLGAALDYVDRIGLETIARYEHELLEYGMACLRTIPGLRLIGTAQEKTSVMSFTLAGWKTDEVGKALNQDGIAVRAGHHCAQPILRRFGVEATVRPSVAFYNTFEEIDVMVAALRRLAAQRR